MTEYSAAAEAPQPPQSRLYAAAAHSWRAIKDLAEHAALSKYAYSVARTAALDQYRRTTPWWWATLVILGSPLPCILLAVGSNYMPLEPVEAGWRASPVLYVRTCLLTVASITCIRWQREAYVTTGATTPAQNLAATLVCTTVYVGVFVLLSATVAYPMPFGLLLPLLVAYPTSMLLVKWALARNSAARVAPRPAAAATTTNNGNEPLDQLAKYRRVMLFT